MDLGFVRFLHFQIQTVRKRLEYAKLKVFFVEVYDLQNIEIKIQYLHFRNNNLASALLISGKHLLAISSPFQFFARLLFFCKIYNFL